MSSISRGKWLALLCLVPFALFFIVFEIAPLVWVLINSLQTEDTGWGLDNFTRIFSSKFYLQAIQFSLHAYYIVGDLPHDDTYRIVNNLNSAGVLVCILFGVVASWRKQLHAAK